MGFSNGGVGSPSRLRKGVEASRFLAALDASQNRHAKGAAALRQVSGPFLLSPFVLAELDYLLATRVGVHAQRALLDGLARGAYRLEPFTTEDVAAAAFVLRRYRDLEIGLADRREPRSARREPRWMANPQSPAFPGPARTERATLSNSPRSLNSWSQS